MPLARNCLWVFCGCLVFASAPPIWSQRTGSKPGTVEPTADKVRLLQRQLDDMKVQMESIQAQIRELSSSDVSKAEDTWPSSAASAKTTASTSKSSGAEESGGAQADALKIAPKLQETGEA